MLFHIFLIKFLKPKTEQLPPAIIFMLLNKFLNPVKNIYEEYRLVSREEGFAIMKNERGELFKERIGEGKKVLDLGCRDGALTEFFVKNNEVLGVEIDERSLNKAKENLKINTLSIDLNGDWQELERQKFDVVVAGEILEHLYFPEKVLKKVKKHLVPGGMFLGSIPNAFSLKNRLRYLRGHKEFTPLSDPTHINQFSYHDFKKILSEQFDEVEIIGLGRYRRLARWCSNWFAFILFFCAKNKK